MPRGPGPGHGYRPMVPCGYHGVWYARSSTRPALCSKSCQKGILSVRIGVVVAAYDTWLPNGVWELARRRSECGRYCPMCLQEGKKRTWPWQSPSIRLRLTKRGTKPCRTALR